MEQGIMRKLATDEQFVTVWDALQFCFKNKLWTYVRVVLKEDGFYHIEGK